MFECFFVDWVVLWAIITVLFFFFLIFNFLYFNFSFEDKDKIIGGVVVKCGENVWWLLLEWIWYLHLR